MDMPVASSDFEAFVSDPERQRRIEEVAVRAESLGVDYIYFQYVTVTGRVLGKAMPASHWRRVANSGIQAVYGATANVAIDRRGAFIGYGSEASELVGLPDPETFCQLPWNPRIGRVFCTLFRNREEAEEPGAFLTSDCRGNLIRIYRQFRRDHDDLQLRIGCEPEMLWLYRDADGKPGKGVTAPYPYHLEQFEELNRVVLSVSDHSRAMGLDMIQADHEDAPGQLEQNFMFDECVRTADRLIAYRQICAHVARELNLYACFMAKPFMGVSANGCHHNISLWKGGEETVVPLGLKALPGMDEVFVYRSGGSNVFAGTGSGFMPSELGRFAIGGILAHLPALTALGCSTVNSYRRILDQGLWAPVYENWGFQNRTCALRMSSPDRVEYRAVDSMVNPYLLMAGLLKAIDHGIRERIQPGEPENRNVYELERAGHPVRKLPTTLGDALLALAADEVVRSALPGDMYRVFDHFKRDEWERFCATVTPWDFDTYADFIP